MLLRSSCVVCCLLLAFSCGGGGGTDDAGSGGGTAAAGGGTAATGGGTAATGGGSALGGGTASTGGGTAATGGGTAAAGGGTAATGGGTAATGGGTADAGTPPTFSYTPGWEGVTGVDVYGSFGTATDWTMPFTTLTSDGGTYTGTSTLPNGTYAYVFRVHGDSAGPANSSRYVTDPLNSAVDICPTDSFAYKENATNPCSQLFVPAPPPSTLHNISGVVNVDGVGTSGWLVIVEREEPAQHHYFANRVNSDANGAFSLQVAEGTWRLQVWHPTLLSMTDVERNPLLYPAQRRTISSRIPVMADVRVPTPELAFHDYDLMTPADGGTFALPTDFSFTRAPWAANVHLAVYGGNDGGAQNIGDPWFTSKNYQFTSGDSTFDGGFSTAQATEVSVRPTEHYFWGTSHADAVDGGTNWTAESMVFPIYFQ